MIGTIVIRLDMRERQRIQRFVIVGLTSTALDFILLAVLKTAGLETVIANTIAFSLATIYNFGMSRIWTYADGPRRPMAAQFALFSCVSLIGLALNDLVVVMLDGPFHMLLSDAAWSYVPAKLLATAAVALWSYVTNRVLIFATPAAPVRALPGQQVS